MAIRLDAPIKREVTIGDQLYMLTLSPESVTIVRKGARKGLCVTWASLLEGSPQLQRDLLLSLKAVQAAKAAKTAQEGAAKHERAGKPPSRRRR